MTIHNNYRVVFAARVDADSPGAAAEKLFKFMQVTTVARFDVYDDENKQHYDIQIDKVD